MRRSAVILFAAMTLFSLAQVAGAYPDGTVTLVGNSLVGGLNGYGPYQTGVGGEFTFKVSDSLLPYLNLYDTTKTLDRVGVPNLTNFQTFCLEESEYISSNGTYDVVLNTKAVMGGGSAHGGGPQGDPISVGTAYLYQQFAEGTLVGYNYDPNHPADRSISAGLLQNAIWYLEDENSNATLSNNKFLSMAYNMFTHPKEDSNGAYGVMVLNLYDSHGGLAQDQLILVPEPGTLLLLGLGLAGFALWGRQRRG